MLFHVLLPAGFHFGVATAGFQVEGGYNGPGEPLNNWSWWEATGRVEPSGLALDFWRLYEEQLARAASLGCTSFRMSIEWARCEPFEGEVDESAFERYAAILASCARQGLEPLVTLQHFTHPAWLGEEFWLKPDSPERFVGWARAVVTRLGHLCSKWVTVNEPNDLAIQSYLVGAFPPGRSVDPSSALRSLDHMLAAHVGAYEVIHAHQPHAAVSTNVSCSSVYELDRLLVDLLLIRAHGVARGEASAWLKQRRSLYYSTIQEPPGALPGRKEAALRALLSRVVPLAKPFPRTLGAVYGSSYERTLDCVQIDYYDPVVSNHLRLPGHRSAGGRNWEPSRKLWDDRMDPGALKRYCSANYEPGLDVWIVENGLCNLVRHAVSYPRLDGWDRVGYLEEILLSVAGTLEAGVPVAGYWHWTLADNYEWGSYEPRFGLYGVDRHRGLRWNENDSMGGDAAGAYRRGIEALRSGDPSALPADRHRRATGRR